MPRGRPRTVNADPATTPATPARATRRGRPRAAENAEGGATPEVEGADAPVRRRRRRRQTTDYAAETSSLIEAVLKSRGSKGADTALLEKVMAWAREVREETEALRELSTRPRRLKAQAPAERITRHEMNRALLDGIAAGTIALDVQENGSMVFTYGGGNQSAPASSSAGDADATPMGDATTA